MMGFKLFLLAICLVAAQADYNGIDTTNDELDTVTEAIFAADNSIASYITVNLQSQTSSSSKSDDASEPLLTVDSAVWDLPVEAAYKALLDQYTADVYVAETLTEKKQTLQDNFLAAYLDTDAAQILEEFLISKGYISSSTQFEKLLNHVWFGIFKRSSTAAVGSCGFEHMFRFEKRDDDLLGLHSALFFNIAETDYGLNYEGYESYEDLGDGRGVISVRFTWEYEDLTKSEDSFFIGLSTETQFSLYSLCLITRPNRGCKTSLNGQYIYIDAYSSEYNDSYYLGSAYPSI